jgi:integrase
MQLRDIRSDDLRRFTKAIRDGGGSDSTLGKHLRQLSAMLASVDTDYLPVNPVKKYRGGLKLRVGSGTPAFTDVELGKLWAQMRKLRYPDVYIVACKTMTVTGIRIGELVALDWEDIDLTNRQLHVRATWDELDGRQLPKDEQPRTVYLLPAAVELLEGWVRTVGARASGPVFPGARSGDRMSARYLARIVTHAMGKAGIEKIGEGGRPRRPLHSFRATYARTLREAGTDPHFVQKQLGHSTLDLTEQVYGRWAEAAYRRVADESKAKFRI